MKILSIYFPTYNRPRQLLNTLNSLLPQLLPMVSVVVLDNCSDTVLEEFCCSESSLIRKLTQEGQIGFIRNVANVGMSANFMRAFELCQTEWMWLVSDDDEIPKNAVKSILANIETLNDQNEVAFIKFSSKNCENTKEREYVSNIEDLIDILSISVDYFNSYLLISNGLYRINKFRSEIQTGYQNLHTYVPHLMMLLEYVYKNKGQRCIYLSADHVAKYVKPRVGYSYGIVAGLGVGAFKNFTYDLSREKYQQLENVFAAHNDFKVTIDLYYRAKFYSNLYVARKLTQNYYLLIRNARGLWHRVLYRLFNSLLNVPILFDFVIRGMRRSSAVIDMHVEEIVQKYDPEGNRSLGYKQIDAVS